MSQRRWNQSCPLFRAPNNRSKRGVSEVSWGVGVQPAAVVQRSLWLSALGAWLSDENAPR